MTNSISLAGGDQNDTLLKSSATLEPGCFWRVKHSFETIGELKSHGFRRGGNRWIEGDIHLLVKLCLFDDKLQSLSVLGHPKYGALNEYNVPVDLFMECFEPASEAEAQAQRDAFVAGVMKNVSDIQEDMARGSQNPLCLPGVQEAAEEAVKKFEADEQLKALKETQNAQEREQDIRRIHRRAARRSEAKGNPVALRTVAVSDSVSAMVSEGITAEGVRELRLESGRRIAIANAASTWLSKRSGEIAIALKRLSPVYEEKGQIALAKSSQAIEYVGELSKGIASLKLYTGEGVTVVAVRDGAGAQDEHPLALLQAKRFMDEELAVHADVDVNFDWRSQSEFFDRLRASDDLLNQVLPLPRCVCTMAVSRRTIEYSRDLHWFDLMQNEIKNKSVFLLIRNGGNVFAVYSEEPSHEMAARLFPTKADLGSHFKGVDGTKIGLQDVAFNKAATQFEAMGLGYKRFLILLAGLDHREKLFGDFYPRDMSMQFMSLEFQSQYFRFVEDDETSMQIDDGAFTSVRDWMMGLNRSVQTGSRVVVAQGGALFRACSATKKRDPSTFRIDKARVPGFFTVKGGKAGHYIEVPFVNEDSGARSLSKAFLDGPDVDRTRDVWFLCVDRARLSDVDAFLQSSRQRAGDIAWIRTMKRVQQALRSDAEAEAELRLYLAKTAVEAGVLTEDAVHEAIEEAVATWRASKNGSPAPVLSDTASVHEILTLMYPSEDLIVSAGRMAAEMCAKDGLTPLRLSRTGTGRWVLYVECKDADKEAMTKGVYWGWVKRLLLDNKKSGFKVASTSLVWFQKNVVDATEQTVREWPEIEKWVHEWAQPFAVSKLVDAAKELAYTESMLPVFWEKTSCASGVGEKKSLPEDLMDEILAELWSARLKTYHDARYVCFLLGVYQHINTSHPVFVYAMANASSFVASYGTESDIAKARARAHRSRTGIKEFESDAEWKIICTKNLLKSHTFKRGDEENWGPNWSCMTTNKRGGRKANFYSWGFGSPKVTKAERRSKGGMPGHEEMTATLSMTRAFETLMGVAPHVKKQFYSKKNQRFSFKHGKELKEEKAKVFIPSVPVCFDFMYLAWDEKRKRSFANSIFFKG